MTDSYYQPDITGINPKYTVTNSIYTVTRTGMVLDFQTPIYYDSLKIVVLADGRSLTDPTDYSLNVRDDTAESRALNRDSKFNSRLARSIKINTKVITPFQISVSYQTFYPATPVDAISSQDGVVNLTPDTIKDIEARLLSVENKSLMAGSTSIPQNATVVALQSDISGVNPKNVISNEIHSVNTFQGQNVIFPVQGAFFKDSLVITINGNKLTPDVDFKVAQFDHYRTTITTNRSGIYHCVVITTDYAGDNVSLTYHAVGGKATVADIIRLEAGYSDLVTFLSGNQFLTTGTLGSESIIESLKNRISILEKDMRAFAQTPTYGKTSSGTTVTRTLKANDAQLHWWTIGSLYTVDGGNEIFTADAFKCHIEMPDRHLQADVTLYVDINNPTQPLRIASQGVFYDQGFIIGGDVQTVTPPPTVLFRIIYNQTADNASGIYLQIGTSLPSLVERIGITDVSGVESAWYLALPVSNEVALPNDQEPITMPNQSRVWHSNTDGSISAIVTLPLEEGYLINSGSTDLSSISSPAVSNTSPFSTPSVLSVYQPLKQIKGFNVYYTVKNQNGISTNGVLSIPAVYTGTTGRVMGQTALEDFAFADLSSGTLRVSLDRKNLYFYYSGSTQPAGTFIINYVTAQTTGLCL